MSETTGPLSYITEETARVIDAAHIEGFPHRPPGGLAIYFPCLSAKSDQRLRPTGEVITQAYIYNMECVLMSAHC